MRAFARARRSTIEWICAFRMYLESKCGKRKYCSRVFLFILIMWLRSIGVTPNVWLLLLLLLGWCCRYELPQHISFASKSIFDTHWSSSSSSSSTGWRDTNAIRFPVMPRLRLQRRRPHVLLFSFFFRLFKCFLIKWELGLDSCCTQFRVNEWMERICCNVYVLHLIWAIFVFFFSFSFFSPFEGCFSALLCLKGSNWTLVPASRNVINPLSPSPCTHLY